MKSADKASSTKPMAVISLKYVALVTILAIGFFVIVDPSAGSSWIIMLGSVVLTILIYVWLALGIRVIAVFWPFSMRLQRGLAISSTLVVMFMILMQSIGELSWRDALAIVPLVALLYIYIAYMSTSRQAPTDHTRLG